MSKFTRAVVAAATLAAITLASMTTAAHAQATDEPTGQDVRRPPTQGPIAEAWHRRSATSQQDKATDATSGGCWPRALLHPRFDARPAARLSAHPTEPTAQLAPRLPRCAGRADAGGRPGRRGCQTGKPPGPTQATSLTMTVAEAAPRRRQALTNAREPPPAAPARDSFHLMLQAHSQKGGNVSVPTQPIHRLAHLAQRPDGGVEWACPQCGRYLVRYPNRELVVAAGVLGPSHILGSGYRDDPLEGPSVSEFD